MLCYYLSTTDADDEIMMMMVMMMMMMMICTAKHASSQSVSLTNGSDTKITADAS